MGAGNVKAVYALWAHLPDPAFRVLVYMGLVSKDDAVPPAYWGGRERLALCMGRPAPHNEADWRAVTRAISQLKAAKAIIVIPHGPLSNARYELVLDPATVDVSRPLNSGRVTSSEQETPDDPNTGRPATEHWTPHDRTLDAGRPPKEYQEPTGLTPGRTTSIPASTSDRASNRREMDDEVDAICKHLVDAVMANGSRRPLITTEWRNAASRMLKEDQIPAADIHAAIDWSQADGFWRAHILTVPKLREKYDQLRLAANRPKAPRKGDIDWDAAYARIVLGERKGA